MIFNCLFQTQIYHKYIIVEYLLKMVLCVGAYPEKN